MWSRGPHLTCHTWLPTGLTTSTLQVSGPRAGCPQSFRNGSLTPLILSYLISSQCRRACWPFLVSLSARNKPPLWRCPPWSSRAQRDALITTATKSRPKRWHRHPCCSFINLLSTNERPNLSISVLSFLHKFIIPLSKKYKKLAGSSFLIMY